MGRIDIYVAYADPHNMSDKAKWKPLNPRTWTNQIDRALKPKKPSKGFPRPIPDPEANRPKG